MRYIKNQSLVGAYAGVRRGSVRSRPRPTRKGCPPAPPECFTTVRWEGGKKICEIHCLINPFVTSEGG